MDLTAFYAQFRDETAENVRVLGDGLLAMESAPDEAARRVEVDRVFRAMHTVKGSARMLGFEPVGRLAHAMESALGELRQGRRALDRALADALLRGGDALITLAAAALEGRPSEVDIAALTAALAVTAPEEPPPAAHSPAPALPNAPAPPAPPPSRPRQTVRVRVDRLDRMLNLAGELAVGLQVLDNHAEQLQVLQELAGRQRRALAALEAELDRLRFSPAQRQALDRRIEALSEASGEAQALVQRQAESFGRHGAQHNLLVKDLEQEVMAARLLPIATLYAGLPRAVRDLAQATGKEVRLELRGESVELDRKVLELVNDPLLHLVRNAVDHGLELPDERVAAGKPAQGLVAVSAEAVGGEVRLVIADDGRGMDPRQLRERAVRLGLVAAEAASLLSDAEALDLTFLPGFSTAAAVTDISGRGVGMDVARTNIAELGGQVRVESQPGLGTRIVLTLPLTLVTTRVLLVRAGSATFALPAASCRGATWVHSAELRALGDHPTVEREGATLAVLPLAELLGVEATRPFAVDGRAPAVVVGGTKRPVALLVDALLDEREAVVKPLGALLARQRNYGGAVQLGDGSLVLLINPVALAQGVRPADRAAQPARAPRPRSRLLVVDDSFTTRELIRSILQSAGYEVTVAVDGADGLAKLRAAPFDLVMSDVEMPRLDGFQLAASVRAGVVGRDVPVVLVTSLASDEHRRRGLEAGASAYIVKSQFSQDSLLDVVRQLLGER
jgi:two-component system chemotaxis sensor kinase CheA